MPRIQTHPKFSTTGQIGTPLVDYFQLVSGHVNESEHHMTLHTAVRVIVNLVLHLLHPSHSWYRMGPEVRIQDTTTKRHYLQFVHRLPQKKEDAIFFVYRLFFSGLRLPAKPAAGFRPPKLLAAPNRHITSSRAECKRSRVTLASS